MVRKQLYLSEAQDAALKERARSSGMSEAEVVRRALDVELLERSHEAARRWVPGRQEAVEKLIALWSDTSTVVKGRFDREELYAERLDRYGR
ncbi:MAG TPA: CopG family transcriptional regulator [Trueperaceae bacterium]|nr:CopG family transcriptional regulator [Trueperaceae bacterium]